MTYRQVLEEFDEKFAWAIWEKADEELFDGYKGVKSFLKQSFIKYLQGEVEFLDTKKNRFDENTETLANAGYSIALDEISLRLQKQIKEIEETV